MFLGVIQVKETATIIALSGKGGVGKTSISAAIVKLLVQAFPDKKILAIDADPAVGLSTALGIDVKMTIDDIRKEIVETVEDGQTRAAIELLGDARYKIFDALVETDGFAFIAVGRPESAGCYCKINTYLKEVISILSNEFDYVVIDGEAGIEQINRRVMEKVSHLLLITDASKKGTQVISTIKRVADELVMYKKIGAIVNRIPDESVIPYIDTNGIPVLSYISTDSNLAIYDIEGKNITKLPNDSNVVEGAKKALVEMGILQ
ncbi:MAG: cobyrinic acid a,c-diamide synthase [Ruminococcaceae bacterium]|nr:cobyrinic acid a,c-diamide synthase [Oscillospiraceae bacterium]